MDCVKITSVNSPAHVFHPQYKTYICKHYKRGKCTRGAACNFAHGTNELRKQFKPQQKTGMIQKVQKENDIIVKNKVKCIVGDEEQEQKQKQKQKQEQKQDQEQEQKQEQEQEQKQEQKQEQEHSELLGCLHQQQKQNTHLQDDTNDYVFL